MKTPGENSETTPSFPIKSTVFNAVITRVKNVTKYRRYIVDISSVGPMKVIFWKNCSVSVYIADISVNYRYIRYKFDTKNAGL